MDLTQPMNATLRFDEFWRWLREHLGCIVEAGTGAATLLDYDEFHWTMTEDEEGQAITQMRRGKNIVAEIVYDPTEVQYVEGAPDLESGVPGQWLFELFSGPKGAATPIGYFVLAHGYEESTKHKVFKH